jgi:pyruvate-formate lyase-activating enzyme
VYHSNGFINPEPLAALCRVLDAANIDLKGFSDASTSIYARVALRLCWQRSRRSGAQGSIWRSRTG